MLRKIWSKIVQFINWLDGIDTPKERKVEPKMSEVENVRTFRDEINRPGRYTVFVQGDLTPGEVYVNGELRCSVYAVNGDLTMPLYLMPGDEVETRGGYAGLLPVQYAT